MITCVYCQQANSVQATLCQKCGKSLQVSRAAWQLGLATKAVEGGNYLEAEGSLARADAAMLPVSPAERAIYLLTARAFWLQGCIYASKGLYEEAERELLLAVGQLAGRADGEAVLADVYNRLGNVCFYKSRRSAAASYYEQSSSLAVAVAAPVIAARAYNNLGNV